MLLRAAVAAAPAGTIEVESIREIPLYDGDVEVEHGLPPAVRRLNDRIAAADGVLIVTPEYNNSMPGVLKNAIDWLSRPAADISRVFRGRPVAVMGATPGPGGTALSQAAWLPVLRTLGVRPWFEGRVLISGAGKVFDSEGRVIDTANAGPHPHVYGGVCRVRRRAARIGTPWTGGHSSPHRDLGCDQREAALLYPDARDASRQRSVNQDDVSSYHLF
jgi:chromate reductase, NAD(P)H dehydrogenase (quinone)